MPSVSKQQQKLFGLVRALQKGDVPPGKVSKQVKDLAKKMKKSDVKAYASTKYDDLPKKVKREDLRKLVKKYGAKRVKESVFAVMGKTRKDGYREPEKPNFEYDPEKVNESVNEYEYAVGDMVKDVNPTCPHNGAIGKVKSIRWDFNANGETLAEKFTKDSEINSLSKDLGDVKVQSLHENFSGYSIELEFKGKGSKSTKLDINHWNTLNKIAKIFIENKKNK